MKKRPRPRLSEALLSLKCYAKKLPIKLVWDKICTLFLNNIIDKTHAYIYSLIKDSKCELKILDF